MNKRLKLMGLLAAAVLLCGAQNGCEPTQQAEKLDPVATPVQVVDANRTDVIRFKVEHVGSFNLGYRGVQRDMMVITDTKTGVEYLAITDCSVIRLKEEEDEAAAESARHAADAIATLLE